MKILLPSPWEVEMLTTGSIEPPIAAMCPGTPGPCIVPITVAVVLTPVQELATAAWWPARPWSNIWEPSGSTSLAKVAVTVMAGSEGRVNPSTPRMIPGGSLWSEGWMTMGWLTGWVLPEVVVKVPTTGWLCEFEGKVPDIEGIAEKVTMLDAWDMTGTSLTATVVTASVASPTGVTVCCAELTTPPWGVMLTGTVEVTGVICVVMTAVGVVVVTGVITAVTTTAMVLTGNDMGAVVTGSWGTAFRGVSLIVVTTGEAIEVTGGRGAGSGLMRLAISSLSSAVRNPLAQSTSVEKRVFLPSTLISLNCSMNCSWSNLPLGRGGDAGSLRWSASKSWMRLGSKLSRNTQWILPLFLCIKLEEYSVWSPPWMLHPMGFPESSSLMELSKSFMNLHNIPSEGEWVNSFIPGGVNPSLPTTPSSTPLW